MRSFQQCPAEIVYFSSRNLQLSKSVALVSSWKKSTTPHLFSPVPNLFTPVHTSRQADRDDVRLSPNCNFSFNLPIFESSYYSVLCPILLKWNTFARLIESFRTVEGLCSCIEIKLTIPLKADALKLSKERGLSAESFLSYVLSC